MGRGRLDITVLKSILSFVIILIILISIRRALGIPSFQERVDAAMSVHREQLTMLSVTPRERVIIESNGLVDTTELPVELIRMKSSGIETIHRASQHNTLDDGIPRHTTILQIDDAHTAVNAAGPRVLAVLPMCNTHIILISSSYMKINMLKEQVIVCTNEAESYFARKVIPFVASSPKPVRVEMVGSRDAQVQALSSIKVEQSVVICAMGTLSQLHGWFGSLKNKMLLEYGDSVDVSRLAHVMPWARMQVVDAANIMQVHTGAPQRLFRVISLDHIISIVHENASTKPLVAALLSSLFSNNEILAATTFYVQHLGESAFAPLVIDMIREASLKIVERGAVDSNDLSVGRPSRTILEQFADDQTQHNKTKNVTLKPNDNVTGFLEFHPDLITKTFTLPSSQIMPRVILQAGDQVHLLNQRRDDENGMYIAVSPTILLSSSSSSHDNTDDHIKNETNVKTAKIKPTPRDGTCITEPRIMNKMQCESAYDAFGRDKPNGPDIWDKPCVKNVDCPFFQANKTYPNYRGGCINGYCELPLGLQRASYRKYYLGEDSFPLCHGCGSDDHDPDIQRKCCDMQGANPNYAFELDAYERLYS